MFFCTGQGRTALFCTDGSQWIWGQNRIGQLQEITPTPTKMENSVLSLGEQGLVMADHSLWLWKENILYRIDNVPENEKRMLNERVMDDVQKVYGPMDGYAILKTETPCG